MRRQIVRMAVVITLCALAPLLFGQGHALAVPAVQQAPPIGDVPYSGQLAAATGGAVADGLYDFRFALYAAADSGDAVWAEEVAQVAVQGGAFNVALGRTQPLAAQFAESGKWWLAVWVRGPGEAAYTALAPRTLFEPALAAVGPAAVDALSCDHTHFAESWAGTSGARGLAVTNSGAGDGLRGYSATADPLYAGVYGVNTGTGAGNGVFGVSPNGYGVRAYSSNSNAVYADSGHSDAVVGSAHVAVKSGVYGVNSGTGYGVFGRSTGGFGMGAAGAGDGSGDDALGDLQLGGARGEIFGTTFLNLYSNSNISVNLDQDNNGNNCFYVFNGIDAIVGSLCEDGTKSAVLATEDFGTRKVYAVESPEVWLEDFGTAALVNGQAAVALDPVFAQMISQDAAYHVFVTPLGESNTLFVAEKTAGGFVVKEAAGGQSSVQFDWRIAAKRAGLEGVRAEVLPADAAELR